MGEEGGGRGREGGKESGATGKGEGVWTGGAATPSAPPHRRPGRGTISGGETGTPPPRHGTREGAHGGHGGGCCSSPCAGAHSSRRRALCARLTRAARRRGVCAAGGRAHPPPPSHPHTPTTRRRHASQLGHPPPSPPNRPQTEGWLKEDGNAGIGGHPPKHKPVSMVPRCPTSGFDHNSGQFSTPTEQAALHTVTPMVVTEKTYTLKTVSTRYINLYINL